MAVKFISADSDYLEVSSAVVTTGPFTISAWFNDDDAAGSAAVVSLADSADDKYHQVFCTFAEKARIVSDNDTTTANAQSTSVYVIDAWSQVVGILVGDADRRIYLDGEAEVKNTTSVTGITPTRTSIGRKGSSSPGNYFSGSIAEVGIWNVALTTDEISMLADGFAPSMIRFDSLVAYWPLIDDYRDEVGIFHLTAGGTPEFSQHPPGIVYPPERERLSSKQKQRRARVS